jgi:PEP-CTERM motif
MINRLTTLMTCGAMALAAAWPGLSYAGVELTNGIKVNERVFNDFPGSTLSTVNNYPTVVQFDESNFGAGGFANRHDALASTDGGASAAVFDIDDGFIISAQVTLNVGSAAPRKEAGIRVNTTVTGDALFLVNSDAGEIVAFGGGAPFFIFGNNGGGNGYTPGDTIFMQMVYEPSGGGANGVPGTVIYNIDRGAGLETSGPLSWSNLEGGPVNYSLGLYGMFQPQQLVGANSADFGRATFENISIVPEPASVAFLGLGMVSVGFRRRNRA